MERCYITFRQNLFFFLLEKLLLSLVCWPTRIHCKWILSHQVFGLKLCKMKNFHHDKNVLRSKIIKSRFFGHRRKENPTHTAKPKYLCRNKIKCIVLNLTRRVFKQTYLFWVVWKPIFCMRSAEFKWFLFFTQDPLHFTHTDTIFLPSPSFKSTIVFTARNSIQSGKNMSSFWYLWHLYKILNFYLQIALLTIEELEVCLVSSCKFWIEYLRRPVSLYLDWVRAPYWGRQLAKMRAPNIRWWIPKMASLVGGSQNNQLGGVRFD